MSELKEISIKAMQAILSSENMDVFIAHGKEGNAKISRYEAVAIESEKYAIAMIKQMKKGGYND